MVSVSFVAKVIPHAVMHCCINVIQKARTIIPRSGSMAEKTALTIPKTITDAIATRTARRQNTIPLLTMFHASPFHAYY
jgi:hypothetical protein